MCYRNEFYLSSERLFVTRSMHNEAYLAHAEARGQAYAFAMATNGKVKPEQIEIRSLEEKDKQEAI